jgi:hypothetical protein
LEPSHFSFDFPSVLDYVLQGLKSRGGGIRRRGHSSDSEVKAGRLSGEERQGVLPHHGGATMEHDLMELAHEPVPGYLSKFWIVLIAASLYLAFILWSTL